MWLAWLDSCSIKLFNYGFDEAIQTTCNHSKPRILILPAAFSIMVEKYFNKLVTVIPVVVQAPGLLL